MLRGHLTPSESAPLRRAFGACLDSSLRHRLSHSVTLEVTSHCSCIRTECLAISVSGCLFRPTDPKAVRHTATRSLPSGSLLEIPATRSNFTTIRIYFYSAGRQRESTAAHVSRRHVRWAPECAYIYTYRNTVSSNVAKSQRT